MKEIEVDLDLIPEFEPLWMEHARYKGAWGGRGGGKSHDRAQAIITLMMNKPGIRIACVREVQKSIKDSVFQLILDWIDRMGVGPLFQSVENEIRGPGGGRCIFTGMNDQTAESIKSLEGFKIVWWEEAQTATEKSLRLLRPTIRAEGSELWFTWNPTLKTDPIDVLLRQNPPSGSIVIESHYHNNPFITDDLEAERLIDLEAADWDEEDPSYRHVWLGGYREASDMQFIRASLVSRARKNVATSSPQDELCLGVDVARGGDDRSVILARRGRDCRTHPPMVFEKMDTMTLVGRVTMQIDAMKPDAVFVDDGGVGGGVVDRLRQLGYHIIAVDSSWAPDGLTTAKVKNKRAEMWQRMKEWLDQPGVALPDTDEVEIDLTGPLYKFDAKNAIQIESKQDMKKRHVRSPDIADALALTFAFPVSARGEAQRQQDSNTCDNDYNPFHDPFRKTG